jgi:hypothetical protein
MAQDAVVVANSQCQLVRIFTPRIEQLFGVKLQLANDGPEEGEDGATRGGRKIVIITAQDDTSQDDTVARVKVSLLSNLISGLAESHCIAVYF